MTQSVKNRIQAIGLGPKSDRELLKIFNAMRSDLLNIALDFANVQIVINNIGSAVANIKTNCSNATVNINAATLVVVNSNTLNTQV